MVDSFPYNAHMITDKEILMWCCSLHSDVQRTAQFITPGQCLAQAALKVAA